MYIFSIPNVLKRIRTYISVIKVIVCIRLLNWRWNLFIFCYITFILHSIALFKLFKSYIIASLFMRWCSVRNIGDWWSRRECLWIWIWRVSNTTSCEENIFRFLGTYMRCPFWCCGIPKKMPQKPFCGLWHIFNAFVSTCAVANHATYGQNKTRRFYTEGFIQVSSFFGVVGLPS